MANSKPYRVLFLVARPAGLQLLRSFLSNPDISVVAVYTHSRKASFEDPERPIREEFSLYQEELSSRGIPLLLVDYARDAKAMPGFDQVGEYDFLIALGWRYLIPKSVLERAQIGNINLHRGKLPQYAGNFPIQRALEDGMSDATITAHVMEPEIDTGAVLFEHDHPMGLRQRETVLDAVERIKKELVPFYPNVALQAVNIMLKRSNRKVINS